MAVVMARSKNKGRLSSEIMILTDKIVISAYGGELRTDEALIKLNKRKRGIRRRLSPKMAITKEQSHQTRTDQTEKDQADGA